MVEDAGAAAVAVHGRTAAQSLSAARPTGISIARVADGADDSGVRQRRLHRAGAGRRAAAAGASTGVLVGRGVLRNPVDLSRRPPTSPPARTPRDVTLAERGQFLLDYIDLLLHERVDEAEGFRHVAPGQAAAEPTQRRRAATIAG